MIENVSRENNLEGMPRVIHATPNRFFDDMEAAGGRKTPMWASCTSPPTAACTPPRPGSKRATAGRGRCARPSLGLAMLRGFAFPYDALQDAWKKLLVNQFHDILPGSSIGASTREAVQVYEQLIREARQAQEERSTACRKTPPAPRCTTPCPSRASSLCLPRSSRRARSPRTARRSRSADRRGPAGASRCRLLGAEPRSPRTGQPPTRRSPPGSPRPARSWKTSWCV